MTSGGTWRGEPAALAWVILPGCSMRDSMPPRDSARVKRRTKEFFGIPSKDGDVERQIKEEKPELSLWDMAGLVTIVTEAGGTFTGLDGTPGPYGPDAAATNGLLHPALLEALR